MHNLSIPSCLSGCLNSSKSAISLNLLTFISRRLKSAFIFISFFFSLCFSLLFPSTSYSETLRVGTTLWPGYEPLYLAKEIGAYKHDIRMIHYPSTSDVMKAFKNKVLEAAALTLDEIVMLSEFNIPVEIILVLDVSEGADVIMGHPKLKNMKGLIGTKIAVESTAVGAYTLSRALETHNIDINQVNLMNSEQSNHLANYERGIVDAVVTYEPLRTRLLNLGAIELFSSKEIPGEIVDVLVVHKGILESHAEDIEDIVLGWFEALEYMKTEPVKSYQFFSSRMKISTRNAKESFYGLILPSLEKNKEFLSGNPSPLKQSINRLSDYMTKAGLVKPKHSDSIMTNTDFLP